MPGRSPRWRRTISNLLSLFLFSSFSLALSCCLIFSFPLPRFLSHYSTVSSWSLSRSFLLHHDRPSSFSSFYNLFFFLAFMVPSIAFLSSFSLFIYTYGVYLSFSIALLFLYFFFFYPANLCTFVLPVCCSFVFLNSFLNRTASRRRGYFDPSFSGTVIPPYSKQHSKRRRTKSFNYFERYVAKNVMSYGSSRCGLRNICTDWNVDRVKVVKRGWRPLICVEFPCILRIRYV